MAIIKPGITLYCGRSKQGNICKVVGIGPDTQQVIVIVSGSIIIITKLISYAEAWGWETWVRRGVCVEQVSLGSMTRETPKHLVSLFCFPREGSPQTGCSRRCWMGVPEVPNPRVGESGLA